MKTLEQIKNEYAVKQGYKEWLDLVLCISTSNVIKSNYGKLSLIGIHLDNICELAQKECLKLASENVITVHHELQTTRNLIKAIRSTKCSITNENNIIK